FAALGASSDAAGKRRSQASEPGLAGDLAAPSASEAVTEAVLKWKFEIGKPAGSDNQAELSGIGDFIFGFRTGDEIWWPMSPAIGGDGTIYFGSKDDHLYALNPDGSLLWKFQAGADVNSAPAVGDDGTIYFGSLDNNLYALNPDGSVKWSFQTGDAVISSPAIAGDGTVYVGSNDNYLYAVNADGSLQWSYPTEDAVISSPAVGRDGTIYVGSFDGFLYALNPDGTLQWKFSTYGGVTSSPAIDLDGTIYFGSLDNHLYALYPYGSLKWKYRTENMVNSSPTIAQDGNIYFGSADKYIYALDPYGNLQWKSFTGSEVWSSPAIGSDGTIYFGSSKDNSYFLKALSPDGWEKWFYQTSDLVLSSPAIGSDGTIYFGSKDYNFYAVESGTGCGLALSPWPKFNRDPQNTGRALDGSILWLPDDQISKNYIPESVGAPFIQQDMATLPGDGTGRLTGTPVYLAPRIESNLTMLTNELVTPPFSFYIACSDWGPNGFQAGRRYVVLQDAQGNVIDDSAPFLIVRGGGNYGRDNVNFRQEITADNLTLDLGVIFDNRRTGSPQMQIDVGIYDGAIVDFIAAQYGGWPNMQTGPIYFGLCYQGLSRTGRFEITWQDAGGGNLSVQVFDHVRGVPVPFSAYIDDDNWGFVPPGTNRKNYIDEWGIAFDGTANVEIPQSERSTLLTQTIPASNLDEFDLYVNGQFWNFSSITAMPAPGSVMAVVSAFGDWNGDWNEFYQYPDPVFPGDKWRIDVPSQNIIPVEPPEPPVVTLSFNEASAEIGSPFDVKIIMNNPVPVSGGQFFISAYPDDQVTFCGVSPSSAMGPGWSASIKDTLGSPMIVFYSEAGETIDPGTRHILNLCCTLTEGADNKPEISLILSEAQLADENDQPVAAILEDGFIFNLSGVGPFSNPPPLPPVVFSTDTYNSVMARGNNLGLVVSTNNYGGPLRNSYHQFPAGSGNIYSTGRWNWGVHVARDCD
ncbi:PQQ-binding-like beta-propeller repeat protein, partial [Gemmatimonadota bacterium]